MTLIGGLRRSVEDPRRPLTDATLAAWFGGPQSDSGVVVSEQRVLGLPTYYRALTITAGALGTLPVKVYKRGTRERIEAPTVLDRPNPRQTSKEWRITTFLHFIAWGNAFSRKVRDGSGQVREVWPLHPSRVQVREVDPTAQNPAGKLFLIHMPNGEELRRTPYDILHLPYMSMDGMQGVRPLEVFRQSLGIAIAGDDSTAKFIANGSRLSGVITTPNALDAEGKTAGRIKARWKELTGGVANTGEIGVLENGATFTPVSIPPADAQMLEGRQWSVDEIGRMIGTPPHLVGNVSGSTSWGTGIEQQVLGWLKFTLQTPVSVSEDRWTNELLPSDQFAEHSLEGLLRGDSKSRAEFYHYGITDGWLVRNEARDHENLTALDGLDEPIVPSNMTLISVDGQIVPLSSAGANAADPSPA